MGGAEQYLKVNKIYFTIDASGQLFPAGYGIYYTNSLDHSGDGYEYQIKAISVPDQDRNVIFKSVINSNPIVYEPDEYGTESYYEININQQRNVWIDISGDSIDGYIWDPKLLRIRGTLIDDGNDDSWGMTIVNDSQMNIIGIDGNYIMSDYSGDEYLVTGLEAIYFQKSSDSLFISFIADKL